MLLLELGLRLLEGDAVRGRLGLVDLLRLLLAARAGLLQVIIQAITTRVSSSKTVPNARAMVP